MKAILSRKSLITLTLTLLIAMFSVLPASAAEVQPNDFYDNSPKYVEIIKLIHFASGGENDPVPMSIWHIAYYPAGRFSGALQLRNPVYSFINSDGSGYHEVTYTGYLYPRAFP